MPKKSTLQQDLAAYDQAGNEAYGLTDLNQDQLPGHVARFRLFHGLVCKSALELKLSKYFAGLEVNALYDLHEDLHGETRGRPSEEEKTEGASVISLEEFLEQNLNVTARTARKYRSHFLSVTDTAPEVAEKLNQTWRGLSEQNPQALPAPGELATTLQPMAVLGEEGLKAIMEHADEWGLNELFEIPERDVTPTASEDDADNEGPDKKAKRAALLKFWTESLVKRLKAEEMLRLPPTAQEAVAFELEESAKKIRENLAAKAAKKNGKK